LSHSKSRAAPNADTALNYEVPCRGRLCHALVDVFGELDCLLHSLACSFQRIPQLYEGAFKLVKDAGEHEKAAPGTCTMHPVAGDPRASSERRGGSALTHTSTPSGCEPHQALSVLLGHLDAVVCYFQGGTDSLTIIVLTNSLFGPELPFSGAAS